MAASDYDATPANNTSVPDGGSGIPLPKSSPGHFPDRLRHALQQIMADMKGLSGGGGGGGDMAAATYDPNTVASDAFDMDNMVEGTTTKVLTATERTKLSGIETSATADQTGAQIKTAYEAEANAFTDAQFTKLAGIETSATADQTGAQIKSAYEGEADTNAFTDADHTKLDGIAAGAEVNATLASIMFTDTGTDSVDSTSWTTHDWDTETHKDAGFTHSTSTNASRITLDDTGTYRIYCQIAITGTTANYRYLGEAQVLVNGTTELTFGSFANYIRATSGHNETSMVIDLTYKFSASDYIEIRSRRVNTTTGDATKIASRSHINIIRL